jgi:rhodanese-related sulfurtransferase
MLFVRTSIIFLGMLLAFSVMADSDEGFPGREKFKSVSVYEISELRDALDKVVVVDARSSYEFGTLRIKGAKNIPVAGKKFEEEVAKLRASTEKPIVFYCNGRSCFKSYIASKKASAAGINNTFAFDAGIFEWTKTYPDQAVLLEQSPVRTADLIPSKVFKSRLLGPDHFSEKATSLKQKTLVLDVRDKYQRAGVGFFPGKERWVSLDQKDRIIRYINKAKKQNRTLYVYDEVGKQVRWLQYEIEKAGLKNYFFMRKGASGYFESLAKNES